jgi:hypothetical protein
MTETQDNTQVEFRTDVYFYVNRLLAQGGKVYLTKDNLVFQPTSILDKALGAKEVVIALSGISKANIQGLLVKNLLIIDNEKVYKFIGHDLNEFLKALQNALQNIPVKQL